MYSAADIEAAFRCAGHPQDTPTLQTSRSLVFAHLEGRCSCIADRCPACDERKVGGRQVHLIWCPMLLAVQPDPPPEGVPLDETTAPVHYEGDTGSV